MLPWSIANPLLLVRNPLYLGAPTLMRIIGHEIETTFDEKFNHPIDAALPQTDDVKLPSKLD